MQAACVGDYIDYDEDRDLKEFSVAADTTSQQTYNLIMNNPVDTLTYCSDDQTCDHRVDVTINVQEEVVDEGGQAIKFDFLINRN